MKLDTNILLKVEKLNVHECNVCTNIYFSRKHLEEHLTKHAPPNIDITNEEVLKHMKSAHVILDQIKSFKCEVCPEQYPSYREYSLHKLQHIQQAVIKSRITKKDNNANSNFIKSFKCTECDLSFVAESTLLTHSIVHEPFPNICECGIGFYAKADLKSHKKLVHPVCYKSEIDDGESTKEELPPKKIKKERKNKKKRSIRSKLGVTPVIKIKFKEKQTRIMKNDDQIAIERDENNRLVCSYCKKTFPDKANLVKHIRIHTGERPYGCDRCGKRFNQSGSLKLHLERHDGIKKFKCNHCGKAFHAKGDVVVHERTHTKEKPYKCTYCDKAFGDPSAFGRHTRIHTGYKPYQCPYCPMKYGDASALIMHKLRHENKKEVKCNVCDKMFYTKDNLRKHMVVHTKTKDFECQDCGKTFGLKKYLKIHRYLVHNSAMPYECVYCERKFKCKVYLKNHYINVHSSTKNYAFECDECGRKFTRKTRMATHFMRKHSDIKKYECDHCCKIYATKDLLKAHILINHSTIHCNMCTKRFTSNSELDKHKLAGCIKCFICHRGFPIMSRLTSHLAQVHSVNETNDLSECNECGKLYKNNEALKRHCRNIHRYDKKFECHDCGEKFALKSMLRYHIKCNHTECVYCDVCHKRFCGETDLKKHKYDGCNIMTCGICDKVFYGTVALKNHIVVHIDVFKYECDVCGKKFKRKNCVLRHLKLVHAGGLMQ